MAKESKKTKQIGVRFNAELLDKAILSGLAKSPQTALNVYEGIYAKSIDVMQDVKIQDATKPNKEAKSFKQPKTNFSINTVPIKSDRDRRKGEGLLDYRIRMSEKF